MKWRSMAPAASTSVALRGTAAEGVAATLIAACIGAVLWAFGRGLGADLTRPEVQVPLLGALVAGFLSLSTKSEARRVAAGWGALWLAGTALISAMLA